MECIITSAINHPDVCKPSSYEGEIFRSRFRIQLPLFKDVILPECINENIFDMKKTKRFLLNAVKNVQNRQYY